MPFESVIGPSLELICASLDPFGLNPHPATAARTSTRIAISLA